MTAPPRTRGANRVLTLSTVGFTAMFAVWLMFGILGKPISQEFGLREVATAIPTFLVSLVDSYGPLLALAFLVGFAGNSFTAGVAWNSAWTPRERQGLALGIFGAGNVGASVTKFIGPPLILGTAGMTFAFGIQGGWRLVPVLYAVILAGWLPTYYIDNLDVTLTITGLFTALFMFSASRLRPVGGWFSDRWGARSSMYGTFLVMLVCNVILMMTNGRILIDQADGTQTEQLPYAIGIVPFTIVLFILTAMCLAWMHWTVVHMLHERSPDLATELEKPEPAPEAATPYTQEVHA